MTVTWASYADRLKEDLVLPACPASDRIDFVLVQRNLTFDPDGQGGYLAKDCRGRTVFHVLPPTVHDAAGRAGRP